LKLYLLVIDTILLCPGSQTRFQQSSVINPSVLLQDLDHAVVTVRYLISLLVCAVLRVYVITFTPHFKSSPEWASVSWSTCELHIIFSLPRGMGLPHLKTAWFMRWHHSLPTFRSEIASSARMSAPSFAGPPRCAFTLTRCAFTFRSSPRKYLFPYNSLLQYLIFRDGCCQNILVRCFHHRWRSTCGCYANTASAPLSACHEAIVNTLSIQANLSWNPPPPSLVPLGTAALSFFLLKLLYPAPILPF